MFGLFENKKKAPATFAGLKFDMHCHLLPLVDDGSRCLEESVDVLKTMKEVGFEGVYLTPHFAHPRFKNNKEDILKRFDAFRGEVDACSDKALLPAIAGVAGEFRLDEGFTGYLESGGLLSLPCTSLGGNDGKGLLLIEFSLLNQRMGFADVIFKCQMEGYEVVLAHPERYPYIDLRSREMAELRDQGVLFQSNILSFEGFYGVVVRKRAYELLELGWIDFLGTDMHNTVYAEALRRAAFDRGIRKMMEKHVFRNSELSNS